MNMDVDKSAESLKTLHISKEKTPPRTAEMDGPVRRLSRRIQSQKRKQILSPKCLIYDKATTSTRKKVKRKRIDSENDKKVKPKEKSNDTSFNNNDEESLLGYREGLSEYELKRLETIRENQAFLSSLKLSEISDSLREKPKQTKKREMKVKEETGPVRKSIRLQKKDAFTPCAHKVKKPIKYPPGSIPVDPLNLDKHAGLPKDLLNIWKEVPKRLKAKTSDLKSYEDTLQKMTLDDRGVVKIVLHHISSAAFHPASSGLLVAAGSAMGHLGLWKMDAEWGDDGVLLFKPHNLKITCMAFSTKTSNLITLSNDGFARNMDLEKAVFDKVHCSNSILKTFDFISSDCSTLLIGYSKGCVAVVDQRTSRASDESLYFLDAKLSSVHVHPVQQQYFVVAENRSVNIYDLRHLKRKENQKVCRLDGHFSSISGAYFSPNSGNRVVTTCMDNIRVFDTSQMVDSAPLLSTTIHNMPTGYNVKLNAMWDPKQEDCFVIGNTYECHKVQVYHESGHLLHNFESEHLITMCPVTAFHPNRNALLAGSLHGRMHVFSDQY